jgi:chromosome partitioning protein
MSPLLAQAHAVGEIGEMAAFKILVGSLKGGVGKSAIAALLAALYRRAGHRVLLFDADLGGSSSATEFGLDQANRGIDGPTVAAMDDGAIDEDPGVPLLTLDQLEDFIGDRFDIVVIDGPPKIKSENEALMGMVDLVVVPVTPGKSPISNTRKTLALTENVKAWRPDLGVCVLLNKMDGTSVAQATRKLLQREDMPLLQSELGLRVSVNEAQGAACGITEYKRACKPSRAELRAVAVELFEVAGDRNVENRQAS